MCIRDSVMAVVEKGTGKEIVKRETGFTVKSLILVNVVNGRVEIEGSVAE